MLRFSSLVRITAITAVQEATTNTGVDPAFPVAVSVPGRELYRTQVRCQRALSTRSYARWLEHMVAAANAPINGLPVR